jgi:dihydroxy-acid dehydratase
MTKVMNKYSSQITQPKSQGASQAMLYATGLREQDMAKPQVGIASMWYEGNPCNMHLLQLGEKVKEGVIAAGMVGLRFNTIGVSDGISMGTDGMSYSLQSRDLIADSIETVMAAQWYDANVSIPGCDKNMPGCIIAMGRLNRPSLMVYGGTIRAGHQNGQKLDIISAFQSYGQFITHTISEEQRQGIVRHSCPGAGACGGMYTANTMAVAIETLGMSLPYSSSTPAEDALKLDECFRAGAAIGNLLQLDLRPRDIMTRAAFENAMVAVAALGGSTNAVLHLIAMARSVDVPLTIDDFQKISDKTPLLTDFKPSGAYVMEDLQGVGGLPAVLQMLLEEGLLHGDCVTVTGKTLRENLKDLPGLRAGQEIVRPVSNPLKASSHLQILKGNLAPEGAVAKITGKEGLRSGKRLRFRRVDVESTRGRKDCQRPGPRYPLRRPERGPGHARDVDANLGNHGCWFRKGCGIDHGRPLFRRLARIYRRPHHAGGPGGRPDCARADWGLDHHRCQVESAFRRSVRWGVGCPP